MKVVYVVATVKPAQAPQPDVAKTTAYAFDFKTGQQVMTKELQPPIPELKLTDAKQWRLGATTSGVAWINAFTDGHATASPPRTVILSGADLSVTWSDPAPGHVWQDVLSFQRNTQAGKTSGAELRRPSGEAIYQDNDVVTVDAELSDGPDKLVKITHRDSPNVVSTMFFDLNSKTIIKVGDSDRISGGGLAATLSDGRLFVDGRDSTDSQFGFGVWNLRTQQWELLKNREDAKKLPISKVAFFGDHLYVTNTGQTFSCTRPARSRSGLDELDHPALRADIGLDAGLPRRNHRRRRVQGNRHGARPGRSLPRPLVLTPTCGKCHYQISDSASRIARVRYRCMKTVRSFCRICTSVCGILVDVDGDEVVRVRGDQDHPFSHGYCCPKGRALPEMHHHPDRLERPRIRVDGRQQDTTWDVCLDDLGSRLKDIIDRHGPASVGFYFSTMESAGFRMAEALHAAIGTPAKFSPLTIDGTAKPLVSDLVGGFMGLSGRTDLDSCDFLMLVGINPVVSHGHAISMPNPTGTVRDIAKRGQVWVIDPRRTETARLASGHLAPRPSTDHAVLAYLVREILRDGMKTDVHVQGIDELAAAVEPFTLEHAAQARRRAGNGTGTTVRGGARRPMRCDRNRHRRHDDG